MTIQVLGSAGGRSLRSYICCTISECIVLFVFIVVLSSNIVEWISIANCLLIAAAMNWYCFVGLGTDG